MEITWGAVEGVIIATPYYEVKAYSPYILSLVHTINAMDLFKVKWAYREISGDSYVDRAKNALVHQFLKEKDYSHIFMIDSDMSWNINGFLRILKAAKYGAEVAGAAYPCKNNWDFFGCIPKMEDGVLLGKEFDVPGGMRLLDMQCIPGGFLCYSRKAFERTRSNLNVYINPESNEEILECFKCNIERTWKFKTNEEYEKMNKEDLLKEIKEFTTSYKGGRIGEDVYFQQRFQECGGTVWLDPDVTLQHWGVKCWEGNYQEFLLEQKKKNDEENKLGSSVEETKEMIGELCE